jgi:antitoxin MazE
LDKYRIGDKVEIILEDDQIVLKPIKTPREGWAESFKKLHKEGDDQLLIPDVFEDEDFEEWK